jgi:uncharacterized repeat protein (TIGR01451 family)
MKRQARVQATMKARDSIFMVILAALPLAGCVKRTESVGPLDGGADIIVTGQGPSVPIASGQNALFTIRVANAGPNDADGVRLEDTVGVHSKLQTITCTGEGAACPNPLALSMVVPKMPKGTALNFVFTVKLADIPTGTIINSLVASYDQDPDPNTNSVSLDAIVR